jgi:hypothetical protein
MKFYEKYLSTLFSFLFFPPSPVGSRSTVPTRPPSAHIYKHNSLSNQLECLYLTYHSLKAMHSVGRSSQSHHCGKLRMVSQLAQVSGAFAERQGEVAFLTWWHNIVPVLKESYYHRIVYKIFTYVRSLIDLSPCSHTGLPVLLCQSSLCVSLGSSIRARRIMPSHSKQPVPRPVRTTTKPKQYNTMGSERSVPSSATAMNPITSTYAATARERQINAPMMNKYSKATIQYPSFSEWKALPCKCLSQPSRKKDRMSVTVKRSQLVAMNIRTVERLNRL